MHKNPAPAFTFQPVPEFENSTLALDTMPYLANGLSAIMRHGGGEALMQLPARIGKYELEEFLGGGMSHVYRARDTVIGRTVAVKILTDAGCAGCGSQSALPAPKPAWPATSRTTTSSAFTISARTTSIAPSW